MSTTQTSGTSRTRKVKCTHKSSIFNDSQEAVKTGTKVRKTRRCVTHTADTTGYRLLDQEGGSL